MARRRLKSVEVQTDPVEEALESENRRLRQDFNLLRRVIATMRTKILSFLIDDFPIPSEVVPVADHSF